MAALIYDSTSQAYKDTGGNKVYSSNDSAFVDAGGKVWNGSEWVDAWQNTVKLYDYGYMSDFWVDTSTQADGIATVTKNNDYINLYGSANRTNYSVPDPSISTVEPISIQVGKIIVITFSSSPLNYINWSYGLNMFFTSSRGGNDRTAFTTPKTNGEASINTGFNDANIHTAEFTVTTDIVNRYVKIESEGYYAGVKQANIYQVLIK